MNSVICQPLKQTSFLFLSFELGKIGLFKIWQEIMEYKVFLSAFKTNIIFILELN